MFPAARAETAVARRGDGDRAGQLLDQAMASYERLGAVRDLASSLGP